MKSAISLLSLLLLLSVLSPALGDGRQIVTATITVQAGDTLHITPGSELLFNGYTGITVMGHLKAIGTKEQPIVFTSVTDTAESGGSPFDWNGVEVTSEGAAELAYCLISNTTSGLTAENARSLALDKCIFKNNGQWHLSVNGEIQDVTEGQPYSTAPIIPTPAELAAATSSQEHPTAALTKPPTDTHRIWRWSLIGIGAAAAIGGAVELYHAHDLAQDYNAYVPGKGSFDTATPEERQRHYDSLRRDHSAAQAVGWSLIGAAAVDGVYLRFFF